MGRVPGRQTSGRAELCALVWVSRCPNRPRVTHIDNKGVIAGSKALQAGDAERHLQGKNGDLWAQVALPVPEVRWIKAHKTAEEAQAMGFSEEEHAGNKAADEAAGERAEAARVPKELREERLARVAALERYQRMIAKVQVQYMESLPRGARAAVRRSKRKRRGGAKQKAPRKAGG